jgi:very-short-patch-repair endonuclease
MIPLPHVSRARRGLGPSSRIPRKAWRTGSFRRRHAKPERFLDHGIQQQTFMGGAFRFTTVPVLDVREHLVQVTRPHAATAEPTRAAPSEEPAARPTDGSVRMTPAVRRLVRERDALARVARQALEICHFDPDTGEDLGGAPSAELDCEAACYDCLLSYSNQVDHDLLDRHLIRDLLLRWRDAAVLASPSEAPRGTHTSDLKARCDSDLERKFIDWLDARALRLPTHAQYRIDEADTRADFYYADAFTVVYVDGPHHDHADRTADDEAMADRLLDLGYEVIRIRHDDDWEAVVRRYPSVFGGDS